MENQKSSVISCYLGLTVVRREVLKRVNYYKQQIEVLLFQYKNPLTEVHITLVPPFHTDYETASHINLECALSTLKSTSIVNSTVFYMQGLSSMQFEGDTIIHFPVSVMRKDGDEGSEDEIFSKRVQLFRQQIKAIGGELREKIPENYTPHISVYTKWKGSLSKKVEDLIQKSKQDEIIYFRATYPTLYAKYKGFGYRDLISNPNC